MLPPVLNPSSLYSQEARRDATRIRIYNSVLQQIYNKIKAIARIPGNEKNLWYVVPEFIPGTPRFNIGDAILYLVWNLRNVGYQVDYTHPNLLFISWQNHDSKYHERESPWAQVLASARQQAITTAVTQQPAVVVSTGISAPSTVPITNTSGGFASTGSGASFAGYGEGPKRKTVLKKTNEYRPSSSTGEPQGSSQEISGLISPRHVSFV